MTPTNTIEKVYDETILQATRQLFSVLILEDFDGSHETAQRHFLNALDAAAYARECALNIGRK